MNKQEVYNVLKVCGATFFGVLAMHGYMTKDQATAIMSDLAVIVPAAVSAAGIAASIYSHWNMKKVPEKAIAVQPIDPARTSFNNMVTGEPMTISIPGAAHEAAKVVGALLLGFLLLGSNHAHAATTAPCNIQIIFKSLTPSNFLTNLGACKAADFKAALDDANAVPVDNLAIACLDPASKVVQAVEDSLDGKTGLVTAFQKFRRAKQSGFVGNCLAYVNNTVALQ